MHTDLCSLYSLSDRPWPVVTTADPFFRVPRVEFYEKYVAWYDICFLTNIAYGKFLSLAVWKVIYEK